jgi:class 3 adenylate cyclase
LEPAPVDLEPHSSPDGAVTLLFTDIEDSTEMMERLGERQAYELFRDHATIVRELVGARDGMVVKSQGDGFMTAFSSAHAGVRCAIELQRAIAEADTDPPLRVRVGLHSGFVIADQDGSRTDFFGRGVVLAARIADSARGGEILVSGELKSFTESDPTLAFEPRGERVFKGLSGAHEVYAVRWEEPARA